MTTSNNPENQKPNGLHDLGQIAIEAYFYDGSYYARLANREHWKNRATVIDGEDANETNLLHWGFCCEEQTENQFLLCLILTSATSKKKYDRDYAKARIAHFQKIGKKFYSTAIDAIAQLKANQEQQ